MRYAMRPIPQPTFYLHLALTLLIAALLLPWLTQDKLPAKTESNPIRIQYEPIVTAAPEKQLTVAVYNAASGKIESMLLDEYLVGVVAGEMPATFQEEALKAQAVAARTFCVKTRLNGGCSRCAGADICTDSAHCQAYADLTARQKKWGSQFDAYEEKLRYCVYSTQNRIVTYQGQPIVTLFHSTSGGMTEDVEHVYAQALPYLRAVESPGEEGTSHFSAEKTFSNAEAANKLNAAFSGAKLTAKGLPKMLRVLSRYESGRVESIQVGGVTASGVQIRRALELESANFTIAFSGDSVTFHTLGYGHGVGMSQTGANAMAQEGVGWADILTYYDTGVQISQLWDCISQ
ncbi:MAG: stage II sporulation protein D [Eubacteriales bacterium]|nr:stage II sporulation protein D [Eubacteriales bacterium]